MPISIAHLVSLCCIIILFLHKSLCICSLDVALFLCVNVVQVVIKTSNYPVLSEWYIFSNFRWKTFSFRWNSKLHLFFFLQKGPWKREKDTTRHPVTMSLQKRVPIVNRSSAIWDWLVFYRLIASKVSEIHLINSRARDYKCSWTFTCSFPPQDKT